MNQDRDYTDYNQHAWSIPHPRKTSFQFIINRLTYITPLLVISGFLANFIANNQKIAISSQLKILIFALESTIISIVVFLDYQIDKFRPIHIDDFNISKKGLTKNNRFIPIEKINSSYIERVKTNPSKFINSKPTFSYIKIKTTSRPVVVIFSSQKEAKECIQSLSDYISNP